jgi:hypothetical protein
MKKRSGAPKSAKMQELKQNSTSKHAQNLQGFSFRKQPEPNQPQNSRDPSGTDEQRVEQIDTWNVVLSGSSTARKKLPQFSGQETRARGKKKDGPFPSSLQRRRAQEQRTHAAP